MNYYGAQPTGVLAALPMGAQASVGQFAVTNPDSPMGIQSLVGGQEELAERLRAMGVPKYGLGSFFRKIVPKELRKAASVALPFLPIDPVTKAVLSAGLTKLEGGSTKDALFSAGTSLVSSKLPGSPGSLTRSASVAALNAGVAKARGMDTDDALKAGLESAVADQIVGRLAKTDLGKSITGGINTAADAVTPDFLKLSLDEVNTALDSERFDGADPETAVQRNIIEALGTEAPSAELSDIGKMLDVPVSSPEITIDRINAVSSGLGGSDLSSGSIDAVSSGLGGSDLLALSSNAGTAIDELVLPSNTQSNTLETALNNTVTESVDAASGEKPGYVQRVTTALGEGLGNIRDDLLFKGEDPLPDFLRSGAIVGGGIAALTGLNMQDIEEDPTLTDEQKAILVNYLEGTSGSPVYKERVAPVIDFYKQRRAQYLNTGGEIVGPGTGTSDSVPALLSDGEFVMTAKAVRNAGSGDREKGAAKMYALMNKLEKGAA